MFIVSLLGILIAAGICFGALFSFKKKLSGSVGDEKEAVEKQIAEITTKIDELLQHTAEYVANKDVEQAVSELDAVKQDIQAQKDMLSEIEGKLDGAQVTVDKKEAHHQEVKSSKAQDEEKLVELEASYQSMSDECVGLEQELADSLKYLDALGDELNLNDTQRVALAEYNNALTVASSTLRDLLSEYETVHERLETLKFQHTDLEEEYTKLVEQQLGG